MKYKIRCLTDTMYALDIYEHSLCQSLLVYIQQHFDNLFQIVELRVQYYFSQPSCIYFFCNTLDTTGAVKTAIDTIINDFLEENKKNNG
jgi:hypothetical protein